VHLFLRKISRFGHSCKEYAACGATATQHFRLTGQIGRFRA